MISKESGLHNTAAYEIVHEIFVSKKTVTMIRNGGGSSQDMILFLIHLPQGSVLIINTLIISLPSDPELTRQLPDK